LSDSENSIIVLKNGPADLCNSVTVFASYSKEEDSIPIVLNLREEMDTQWNFVGFLRYCIAHNHLKNGDFLVIPAVHLLLDCLDEARAVCVDAGVQMFILPEYSPALNPCEHVFSFLRKFLRNFNHNNDLLWLEILQGIASIDQQQMNYYYDQSKDIPDMRYIK